MKSYIVREKISPWKKLKNVFFRPWKKKRRYHGKKHFMDNNGIQQSVILILRTHRCRKSDLIIQFLEDEQLPYIVKSLENDAEAQKLAQTFNILSSPGIIVNGQLVNPYQLIENCKVKDRVSARKQLENLLKENES